MKKIIRITFLLLITSTSAISQTGPENIKEGFLLRRLELASSFAKIDLKSNYKSIYKSGFQDFSYQNENNEIITVIIDGFDHRQILARYKFDSIPITTPVEIKTSELLLSPTEEILIKILADATNKINNQYKGNFKPSSTSYFRAIPIISNEPKKVIVYSKSNKIGDDIVFGNDYELQYDSIYNFISLKEFHDKLTSIPFNANGGMVTVHEHETSDEISSTDVCTILLNKDKIQWKQHIVLNPEYVAIFMVQEEKYILMLREEFDETLKKQRNGR